MAKTVVGSFDSFEHARDVVDALERSGMVAVGDVNLVAHDSSRRWTGGTTEMTTPDSTLRSGAWSHGTSTAGLEASGVAPMAGTTAGTRSGAAPDLVAPDSTLQRDTSTGRIYRATDGASGDATSEGSAHDEGAAVGAARGAVAGGAIGGAAGLLAGLAGLAIPGIGPLVAAGPIAAALAGAGIGAVAGGLIGGLTHVGVPDTDAEYYAESVRRGGALVIVRADDGHAQRIADLMRSHGAVDIEARVAAWRQSGWSRFDPHEGEWNTDRIESERRTWTSGTGLAGDEHRDLRTAGTGSTVVGGATVGTAPGRDATIGGSTGGGRPGRDTGIGGTTTGEGLGGGTPGGSTLGGSTAAGGPPGGGTFGGTTGTTGLAGGQIGSGGGLGTSAGSGTLAPRGSSEHPNLGASPDRPGIDTRSRDHASTGRASMTGGEGGSPGGSVREGLQRASDAIERRIPGDSDGDGR